MEHKLNNKSLGERINKEVYNRKIYSDIIFLSIFMSLFLVFLQFMNFNYQISFIFSIIFIIWITFTMIVLLWLLKSMRNRHE